MDVGVCLIGAGRAGMIHANNFRNKVCNAFMASVIDASKEAAQSAAYQLGIDRYHTDYHRILDDDDIKAVIVVTPTNLHKKIVLDCARAGKHIFCEKPMAMNTGECDEMIEACRANNVKLQIGFMRRYDENYMQAKEIIKSGAIGDIVMIRSCTRGPSRPKPWMYDIRESNGILAELNSHDIDCVRWFAESEIKTIYAVGGNFRNKDIADRYPDYYDNVVMNGIFENGIQYSIDGAAYVQYGYDSKVEIVGTKGALQIGRSDGNFVKCTTVENGTSTPFIDSWMTLFKDAYLNEDSQFIHCIQNDIEPKTTGLDGRTAVKIVELGNRSIIEKRLMEA